MKTALLIAVFIASMLAGRFIISNIRNEPESPFNYTKAQYLEEATKKCSESNPESYCRCVYTKYLDRYTVREVLKKDAEAAAQGQNYNFTNEELQMIADCI